MSRKKTILFELLILIIIVLQIVFIFKIRNSKEENLKSVKLNEVTRSVFYAPQYVAIANGYFEEEGISLEITTGQGADNVMTAILSGQSDIGLCGPEAAIYVYNEGKEDYAQIFSQLTKKDGSFLVAREETKNFSWNDLMGKTVIPGRKGGVPYMTLEYVLKQNGINPKTDVILDDSIKFDLMAGAFSAGNADYVTLFEPTASGTVAAGKGYIVTSIGKESGEIPYTAYCAKKSYINENGDTILGFTRAIYKGEQWVKEHTEKEIGEKIQKFFPDTTLESLEQSIKSYKEIDAWCSEPYLKEEAFNKLQDIMKEAGELKEKAPYEKIVNNNFANKVKE